MDLRELLLILDRYKYWMALLCLSAMLTATGMTYVLSEKYRSKAVILIRPQKTLSVVPRKEEMLDFPVSSFTPVAETTRTYSEMLQNQVIAERVLAALGADSFTPAPPPEGWRGLFGRTKQSAKKLVGKTWTMLMYGRIEHEDPRSGAVKEIQKSLTVKPTKETFLFEIQTETKSAELASKIANTAARVFTEYLQERARKHKEAGRESREQTRGRACREFEIRQEAIVEYKERTGSLSPRKETELALEAEAELESIRTDLDKRIEGSDARLKEFNKQLVQCVKFTKSESKQADNPIFVNLTIELEKKKVDMVGLLKKFTPEHRDVKVLQSEIDEVKARIKAHQPTRQSEETVRVNPIYEALSVESAKCLAELESLKAEKGRVITEQNARKTQLAQLARHEVELGNLETLAQLSEEKYRLISKHLDEVELAAATDIPAIEVVQDAYTPVYPARPIKIYNAVLAGILGLLAGMGLALASENITASRRAVEEAANAVPLPPPREGSAFAGRAEQHQSHVTSHRSGSVEGVDI